MSPTFKGPLTWEGIGKSSWNVGASPIKRDLTFYTTFIQFNLAGQSLLGILRHFISFFFKLSVPYKLPVTSECLLNGVNILLQGRVGVLSRQLRQNAQVEEEKENEFQFLILASDLYTFSEAACSRTMHNNGLPGRSATRALWPERGPVLSLLFFLTVPPALSGPRLVKFNYLICWLFFVVLDWGDGRE